MKIDFIDIVLGACLAMVVAGFLFGKASMQDVLMFLAAIGLKKTPSTFGQGK